MTEQEYLNSKALYHPAGGHKTGKIYDVRDATLTLDGHLSVVPPDLTEEDSATRKVTDVSDTVLFPNTDITKIRKYESLNNNYDAAVNVFNDITQSSSTGFNFSFFIKPDTANYIRIYMSGSSDIILNVDHVTETIIVSDPDVDTVTFTSADNGFKRVSISTSVTSITAIYLYVNNASDGKPAVGDACFIAGLQFTKGTELQPYARRKYDLEVTGGGGTRTLADGTIEDIGYYNLITYSEDLSNQKTSYGITIPSTTATGGIIQTDTTTGTHVVGVENIKDAGGNIVVAGYRSVIIKKVNWRYAAILNRTSGATGIIFDFDTAQTYVVEGTYAGSIQNVTVVDLGNGYYRVGFYTNAGSGSNDNLYVGFANGTTVNDVSFTGDGTQQMEVGVLQAVDDVTTMQPYQRNVGSPAFPKIDYSTGQPAFLVEPQRTNNIPDSNYVGGSLYGNTVAEFNALTAPNGELEATLIKDGEAGSSGTAFCQISYNTGNSMPAGLITYTVHYKITTEGDLIGIAPINSTAQGSTVTHVFDKNGTHLGNVAGNGDVGTATVNPVKDGWFRATVTQNLTGDACGCTVRILDSTASSQRTFTGNARVYIWGAQLEVGGNATSLIPTNGALVTRTENIYDQKNTVDQYSSKWIFAELELIDPSMTDIKAYGVQATDDANTTPRSKFFLKWTGTEWQFHCRPSNTGIEDINTGITTTSIKVAINPDGDTRVHTCVINGTSFQNVGSDPSFSIDNLLDRLTVWGNVKLKDLRVYDQATYTIADMEAKTTL